MIVYSAKKKEFSADVMSNEIEDKILQAFRENFGKSPGKSEIQSWKNSMQYMNNVLLDGDFPDDAGVAIEYTVPQTAKRIDFILTGRSESQQDVAIIVELKQWTEAKKTEKDGIVETFVGGAQREVLHPSYQAWTYAALIRDFNQTVQDEEIQLVPCAYLHNCLSADVINDPFYKVHTDQAPVFVRNNTAQLKKFLKQYVRYGDTNQIMYRIEKGKLRPSKNLADHLVALLQGNQEFELIDEQKIVYETALSLSKRSSAGNKNVLIVEGGPGTGKSVVAINLLVEMTKRGLVAQYVTRNAAPRHVYESKLSGSFKKTFITNLFKNSGAYTESDPNIFDALIVDEAHRLNAKSGMYQNLGENQIKEIIEAARFSIFFIDENQRVTFKDIGEKREIRNWAESCDATVHELELQSQFRCNGSDGYLAWIDRVLEIRDTASLSLKGIDFDFRVFDSPNELRNLIREKNRERNKARLVAGYCWDWKGKKNPKIRDVIIPEHDFSMRWNLGSDGGLWIVKPESVDEIGCIHTCQGLELDYVGVIIGKDLVTRNGDVVVDAGQRSSQDSSVRGYKKMLKSEPGRAKDMAETIIKNTYRTLLTRGQRGCYIYCVDKETNQYFRNLIHDHQESTGQVDEKYPGLRLQVFDNENARPYQNCVPIYDLKIAAGAYSEDQYVEDCDWVELPDSFRPQEGHFVARVIGESMNRRIPNGSWCLFNGNPGGTRQEKIVIVQHQDIQDADTGGQYTIKIYSSNKIYSGETWVHTQIILRPDSNMAHYQPIMIEAAREGELKIIGELVAVLW